MGSLRFPIENRSILLRRLTGTEPKQLIFDEAFFVAFLEAGRELPHTALWIADSELLVPRKVETKD